MASCSPSSPRRRAALVVAPNVPCPPRTYSHQVVTAKLKALSAAFDVTFCTALWNQTQAAFLQELGHTTGCSVTGIEALAMRGLGPRVAGKSLSLAQGALTGIPSARLQVCHPLLRRHLRRLVGSRRFDLIQVDYWYMGLGWLPVGAPTLCYAHDLDYLRAASAARSGDGRSLSARQSRRRKAVEIRALSGYRAVAAISPVEADHLRGLLPRQVRVAALPAGIEVGDPARLAPPDRDSRRVVFVGALGSAPNADAALWLVRDIWPRVLAEIPDAALAIVGHGASKALLREGVASGVDLVGEVDDVSAEYETCDVVVAPLRWGSGMKGKVLEALAAGRPLVATPVALEGIDAVEGRDCLIAVDAAAMAGRIVQALRRRDLAFALATAGRRLVQERYERDACMQRYMAFVEGIVTRGDEAV